MNSIDKIPVEVIAKIFEQNIGQKITLPSGSVCILRGISFKPVSCEKLLQVRGNEPTPIIDLLMSGVSINLKSLAIISDEDATELGQLFGLRWAKIHLRGQNETSIVDDTYTLYVRHNNGVLEMRKNNNIIPEDLLKGYDFLRSKGYALPYGPYSVDQLVAVGIYKLIEK